MIVEYEDKADSYRGKARAGTVSGTAIAWGGESTFQPASGADWNGVAALTELKAVVAFKDVADSPGHGKANLAGRLVGLVADGRVHVVPGGARRRSPSAGGS